MCIPWQATRGRAAPLVGIQAGGTSRDVSPSLELEVEQAGLVSILPPKDRVTPSRAHYTNT